MVPFVPGLQAERGKYRKVCISLSLSAWMLGGGCVHVAGICSAGAAGHNSCLGLPQEGLDYLRCGRC